jgi:hypothetical protein
MSAACTTQHFGGIRHGAVLLAYAALALGFEAPPGHWPGLTYFGVGQDPLGFIWFLNWWPFAVAHHLPLLFTHYADAPLGTDLSWKTGVPALALLAAPVTRAFGPVVSYNLLMLAASPLAGFSVYLAAWELSGGVAASFIAGLLFMVSGYALGQGQIHLNLAFCAAVPLCLWACLRAARRGWGSGRLSLVLGLLLAFQFGVSQELFASLVLFGGLALLLAGRAAWALLPGVAGGLGLCLLLIAPLLWQTLMPMAMICWPRSRRHRSACWAGGRCWASPPCSGAVTSNRAGISACRCWPCWR